MTATTCRCGRPADPDDQCVVVIMGAPLCMSCAAEKADDFDKATDLAERERFERAADAAAEMERG